MHKLIVLSQEVFEAVQHSRPILALESTIIAHGMPYPQNLETALKLEQIARDNGAVPATICIHDGKIRIGCDRDLLEHLASSDQVLKAGTREIPEALASGTTAATTVSGTLHCANMAGIKVFATGGIGGVHRGAGLSFDVSADLTQLSRTPMITVTAGAKAILDVPATLEYLETLAIPVYGFCTDTFPLFYSHFSQYPIRKLVSIDGITTRFKMMQECGITSSMLVCNPVPIESEIPYEEMSGWIEKALEENSHLRGPEITPALLKTIVEKTQGRSLKANIALVESNVKLGAMIAVNLCNE